jgi:hypothetical protein
MNPVPRLFSEAKQIIMTDKEIKIMNPVTKTNAQKERNVLKRNLLFAMIGLIVIIVLAIPLLNKAATAAETKANVQRTFATDAARYMAMANFYLSKNGAEAARYEGLADFYANTQRAIEADAARYTALANFYRAENEAEAARYQGLADLYANTQRAIKADAARYTALAAFYPNEERFNSEFFNEMGKGKAVWFLLK